jgi:hypothetical protein
VKAADEDAPVPPAPVVDPSAVVPSYRKIARASAIR